MSYERKAEIFQGLVYTALMIAICSGIVTCNKYQYDECLRIGHTKNYCTAQAVGCFKK